MIVVLDCNVWISLTINRNLDFIANLFNNDAVIASCEDLKSEILDVLSRPKLKKYITPTDIPIVLELHDLVTTYFRPGKLLQVTTDHKDDYLFALSSKSRANFLVTGDKLLLGVERYKSTQVISLIEFRKIITADN